MAEATPAAAVDDGHPVGRRPAPGRAPASSTSTAARRSPPGEKSLAERLVFQALDRTLTDDEIDAAMEAIVAALAERARGTTPGMTEVILRGAGSALLPLRRPACRGIGPVSPRVGIRGDRVNIVDTISNVTAFDWLAVLFLVGFFVLGYVQGTIRRLLGIASIVFSFLLAANLREPLGKFLAGYWTQWPREYSYMLAFLFIFVVASVVFAHPHPVASTSRPRCSPGGRSSTRSSAGSWAWSRAC